jgi:hypothetical protein
MSSPNEFVFHPASSPDSEDDGGHDGSSPVYAVIADRGNRVANVAR